MKNMKKFSLFLLSMLMIMAFSSCKKKTMYIYIDSETTDNEPKVTLIEAEDDTEAYYKCFEKYSESRHYPVFSEIEKSKAIINEGFEACESDEAEQSMAPAGDDVISGKGDVITTNDSDEQSKDYEYPGLEQYVEPNFKVYKITDKESQKVAQDLIDKKISVDEFEKKVKGNSEIIDLYKKDFKKCQDIDKKKYEELKAKFKKREQEAQQKQQ